MPSYKTIKPKNSALTKTATDIHITTVDPAASPKPANPPKLNLRGLNGVPPSDPNASYNEDGDGTDTIDVTDINVGTNGELNIRLECDKDQFPKIWYQWTPASEFGGGWTPIEPAATAASGALALALEQIATLALSARQAASE